MITDNLEDTVCYFEVVKNIQSLCVDRRFNLIEHLNSEVYKVIEKTLGHKRSDIAEIKVVVSKISPPVPGVHGGVSFTYSDTPRIKEE